MIVLSFCYEDSCSYDFSHCACLHRPSFRFFSSCSTHFFFQGNSSSQVPMPHATIHVRALTESRVEFVQCQNGVVNSVPMLAGRCAVLTS